MTYPDQNPDGSVLHWRSGAVAHIRFNRPQALNAIDRGMAAAFHQACQDIAADPQVRAVLITGEGRAFMAGGDLDEMRADPQQAAAQLIAGMHGGIRLLTALQAPVVCAVQGAVAGGGRAGQMGICGFVRGRVGAAQVIEPQGAAAVAPLVRELTWLEAQQAQAMTWCRAGQRGRQAAPGVGVQARRQVDGQHRRGAGMHALQPVGQMAVGRAPPAQPEQGVDGQVPVLRRLFLPGHAGSLRACVRGAGIFGQA